MACDRIHDENRPTCPVCHVRAKLNGRSKGVQQYMCGVCLASGNMEMFEDNALRKAERTGAFDEAPWYDRLLAQPEPEDCELCEERPAMSNGLCRSCAARVSNARRAAARLSEDEKRSEARRAAVLLLAQGYVQVRLR